MSFQQEDMDLLQYTGYLLLEYLIENTERFFKYDTGTPVYCYYEEIYSGYDIDPGEKELSLTMKFWMQYGLEAGSFCLLVLDDDITVIDESLDGVSNVSHLTHFE
mmetsp:Transcript_7294/g.3968  ORF Transcript_7294/g.3968 Transcript_7294/m.3968 type:complete len:105 (-) Transcript_7294:44-358(-)|eukprot:CAMPEP_0201282588 /NCGR_PEP_ID=MMETSP1317-20130820/6079_1 /ASSEMBLY_ACC=CAM_ASM_000770 /TAXON_ID=187299 /ORGANISM="Undescribed Undescribed, Strain Undescribed" /LENGTH=104 /DNA_ID=CAMNT_0047595757 /DNA_START=288 /DNA_END=602 /DNA_ORIENTATION=-